MNKVRLKHILHDTSFILLLLALGVLSFGWVIWPKLGTVVGFINGGIITGIIIVGGIVSLYRHIRSKVQKHD